MSKRQPISYFSGVSQELKNGVEYLLFEYSFESSDDDEKKARTYSYEMVRNYITTFCMDKDMWLKVYIGQNAGDLSYTIFNTSADIETTIQLINDELKLINGKA